MRGSEEPNWALFRDVNVSWAEKLQEQRGQKDEDRQGRNKTLSNTNQFHLFHPWRSSLDPAVPITLVSSCPLQPLCWTVGSQQGLSSFLLLRKAPCGHPTFGTGSFSPSHHVQDRPEICSVDVAHRCSLGR